MEPEKGEYICSGEKILILYFLKCSLKSTRKKVIVCYQFWINSICLCLISTNPISLSVYFVITCLDAWNFSWNLRNVYWQFTDVNIVSALMFISVSREISIYKWGEKMKKTYLAKCEEIQNLKVKKYILVMCQCRFISGDTCTTLVGEVENGGACACVGKGYMGYRCTFIWILLWT